MHRRAEQHRFQVSLFAEVELCVEAERERERRCADRAQQQAPAVQERWQRRVGREEALDARGGEIAGADGCERRSRRRSP